MVQHEVFWIQCFVDGQTTKFFACFAVVLLDKFFLKCTFCEQMFCQIVLFTKLFCFFMAFLFLFCGAAFIVDWGVDWVVDWVPFCVYDLVIFLYLFFHFSTGSIFCAFALFQQFANAPVIFRTRPRNVFLCFLSWWMAMTQQKNHSFHLWFTCSACLSQWDAEYFDRFVYSFIDGHCWKQKKKNRTTKREWC